MLKRIKDKIIKPSGKGKESPIVGSRVYSPYFNRNIIVTQYIDNDHWYFKFEDGNGRTFKAGASLTDVYLAEILHMAKEEGEDADA